jgi:hypothetical protein
MKLPHAAVSLAVAWIKLNGCLGIFDSLIMIALLAICRSTTSMKHINVSIQDQLPSCDNLGNSSLPVSIEDSVVGIMGNGFTVQADSFGVISLGDLTVSLYLELLSLLLIFV